MRNKIIMAVLILAVVAAVILTSIIVDRMLNRHDNEEPEQTVTLTMEQIVLNDLAIRYGEGIEVKQGPEKAETQYITYIVANGYLKAVMWVNGLMYEVASVPLATPIPSPAGE